MSVLTTGMHRSGTSLVASMLARAGVRMGERLLAPDSGNPRGYFEDLDFFEFHKSVLAARVRGGEVPQDFVFVPTEEERRRAEKLVSDRRAEGGVWGWKDPRTALFLDFWMDLIPEARFVLLYRHPLDVVLSLARRGDVNYVGLVEGVEAWVIHNRRILDFYSAHEDRCLLCHIRGVTERLDEFCALLRRKAGLELSVDSARLGELYRPEDLRHAADSRVAVDSFAVIHPVAASLYLDLDEVADLRWGGVEKSEGPQSHEGLDWLKRLGSTSVAQSPGSRRGFTFALVALLEPEVLETSYRTLDLYRKDREQALQWLQGKVRSLEDELARGRESVEALRRGVEELQRGKEWLFEQKERLEAALSRTVEQSEELRGWADELERGRAWLREQNEALEAVLARSEKGNEDLRAWAAELERGRAWLREQNEALSAALARSREGNQELLAWTVELTEGRRWLLEQKEALESALARCNERYDVLHEWAKELRRGRDWLLDQKNRLEAEVAKRAHQYDELRAWAQELERRGERSAGERPGKESKRHGADEP